MAAFSSCRLLEQEAEEAPGLQQLESETEEGQPIAVDSPTMVKIAIWDYMEAKERLALIDSVEEYTSLNPEVDIEVRHIRSEEELLDQFEAASLAGSGPDLALVDLVTVQRLAESNVIKEITDIDYSIFLGGLAEISEYNGKTYIVPFRANDFLIFYYNQAYLGSAPPDFESVIEYCGQVNNPQEQVYGFVLNQDEPDWIIPFIGGYSEWIIDYSNDSLSLDTTAMKKTLDFLCMLYDPQEPLIPQGMGYEEIDAMFKSGNIHMVINSFKAHSQYLEENINLGISIIPEVYGEGKNPTPLIRGIGFMVNVNSFGEELEASKSFIEFMLSTEQQVKWTEKTDTFPAVVAVEEDDYFKNNELLKNILSQAKLCRGIPAENIIRAVRDSLRINVPKVIAGDLPVEEAAGKIQEDAIRLRSGNISIEELREESLQQ